MNNAGMCVISLS